jgi:hypothetical protein
MICVFWAVRNLLLDIYSVEKPKQLSSGRPFLSLEKEPNIVVGEIEEKNIRLRMAY